MPVVAGRRGQQMAIYRILQNSPLGPEEIARLSTSYEQALGTIASRIADDPLTEMIAKKILEIGQTGPQRPCGNLWASGRRVEPPERDDARKVLKEIRLQAQLRQLRDRRGRSGLGHHQQPGRVSCRRRPLTSAGTCP